MHTSARRKVAAAVQTVSRRTVPSILEAPAPTNLQPAFPYLLPPAPAFATGLDHRRGFALGVVLSEQHQLCFLGALAEVAAVDEDAAFLAAFEFERELGHRGVGDAGEGRAGPGDFAFDLGVDEADQLDVDQAVEVGDDVGEVAGAAV